MKNASLALAVAIAVAMPLFAQEHPEHPTSGAKQEKSKPAHAYSMDELEKAITGYIEAEQKKNVDGWYKVKDKETGQTLSMNLDQLARVESRAAGHRERLAKLDPKTYFACTDFKTDDGHTIDVDFFMKDDGEKLVMSDATVHKIDGKPRYNWKEKDGYWVRVPVAK